MIPQLLKQFPLCLLLLMVLSALLVDVSHAMSPIARPGCNDTCGDVSIPFPFGIGANCFLDPWYEIECKPSPKSNGSIKPFLSKFNIEVKKMDWNHYYNLTVIIPPFNSCTAVAQRVSSIDLRGSPYNFSAEENVFTMDGCPGSAFLVTENNTIVSGCATSCNNSSTAMATNQCYGAECCQIMLPESLQFFQVDFDNQSPGEGQNCLVATFDSYPENFPHPSYAFPTVLLWYLHYSKIDWPGLDSHATCDKYHDILVCNCKENYEGNPYVSGGCQVLQGCEGCRGICYPNTHPNKDPYYCVKKPLFNHATILGLSSGFGTILLVIGCYGLYCFIKRKREMKQKAKFFKRNGGLLLQQQLSSNELVEGRTKIFTTTELEKATDHFNENRILGQGGQGTVYKGMLSGGRIVAIKKSKLMDESQLQQFINEVVILSQINHKNVVKLLGCCLETEVPLLVYEFVPNGNLTQHIHNPGEDFVIGWEMRLKIAADSASAIAYLHSSSSIPIYHRDIKSSNILLDEKNRAKVSDFGSSKTIAIDQTHLTTLVQGTMGYLDPEYFQSHQFTEKSDVYSFGVVLLELLTSKKPIYRAETMEQKNLVSEFLFQMQNSSLSNILDPEIVNEAKKEELITVVDLAKRCLSWTGKLRPTMKEVAMTLEMIIKFPTQVPTWDQQAFPYEEIGENAMEEISDGKFMSNPLPAAGGSPVYIDEQPLLSDTI